VSGVAALMIILPQRCSALRFFQKIRDGKGYGKKIGSYIREF
jgi:hypothetical protein